MVNFKQCLALLAVLFSLLFALDSGTERSYAGPARSRPANVNQVNPRNIRGYLTDADIPGYGTYGYRYYDEDIVRGSVSATWAVKVSESVKRKIKTGEKNCAALYNRRIYFFDFSDQNCAQKLGNSSLQRTKVYVCRVDYKVDFLVSLDRSPCPFLNPWVIEGSLTEADTIKDSSSIRDEIGGRPSPLWKVKAKSSVAPKIKRGWGNCVTWYGERIYFYDFERTGSADYDECYNQLKEYSLSKGRVYVCKSGESLLLATVTPDTCPPVVYIYVCAGGKTEEREYYPDRGEDPAAINDICPGTKTLGSIDLKLR